MTYDMTVVLKIHAACQRYQNDIIMARIELCDVRDATIQSIWLKVYSHLDTQDILGGMDVCTVFRALLPDLLKELRIEEAIEQQDLAYIAETYSKLESLEIAPQ